MQKYWITYQMDEVVYVVGDWDQKHWLDNHWNEDGFLAGNLVLVLEKLGLAEKNQ